MPTADMNEFQRIRRLPPYVFGIVNELKAAARARGQDIVDFGMGNPDQPTPQHIVDKLAEAAQRGDTHRYSLSKGIPRLRKAICDWYQRRRDVLCDGLNNAGWPVDRPRATMFVWARIPAAYRQVGSLEFAKKLIVDAKVAVAPGIGFGEYGDDHVRFGLIENEHRIRQAVRGIRDMLRRDGAHAARTASA